jgi:hypothetical protein
MTVYQPALDLDTERQPDPWMLMWLDNTKDPTQVRILRAVAYYEQKFGRSPNLCLLPDTCPAPTSWRELAMIHVVMDHTVLANHIYIGQEEKAC